jgi:UDP-2,4-diacetamido-2,4,6-trideoxy-beta-L-altropyranose hydrolase
MKVVFRADASIQMGTGHVMRCLTLADELQHQGHECSFICRDHPGHLGRLIADKGFGLDLLSAGGGEDSHLSENDGTRHAEWLGVSSQVDAQQSQAALDETNPDWLVVDHYALDAHWERQVSPVVGRIMAIDDLADREHQVHLLLDQNLGRSANDYNELVPDHCIRLIGPRYALLRPEFSEFRVRSLRRRGKAKLRRILISMGGMDTPNTTASVLTALEASDLPSTLNLDVIMGSTAPWLDEVRHLSERSRFDIRMSTDVQNMAERMCLADLSIGAAGSTSWERCVLGLASIAVSQAHNQSAILEALAVAGAAERLSFPFEDRELSGIVNSFLQDPEKLSTMAANASRVCDGMGTGRVVGWLNG